MEKSVGMMRRLELWFQDELVGLIHNGFCSEGTWHGVFVACAPGERPAEAGSRIADFITFCQEWNERARRETRGAPDAREFERYSDLIGQRRWSIRSPQGMVGWISEAPVFFQGGDVSWTMVDGEPG